MPSVPITSVNNAYLLDNAGDYIVADTTTPNGPLVTPNASLTSNARHVITRSGNTVVAASSGRDIYTRGGIGPVWCQNARLWSICLHKQQLMLWCSKLPCPTVRSALVDPATYGACRYRSWLGITS